MIKLMLLISICTVGQAFCPFKCQCDDRKMKVVCESEAHLDIIPITLNPGIKEIHLRGNQIRTVDASFQFYGQLELVDFSNNQMASLPDRCFAKQSKLTHLKMDFNQIGNVTNATFLGLRSLTHLSLRGNRLASIDGRGIASLNELLELDLGQNSIEFISEDAFVTLKKLEVLHLDANKLASVPSTPILRPISASLTSLNLGQNAIQTLEADVFLPLKNLRLLNLTGASIVNISSDAFRGLGGGHLFNSGLKTLSLASNALDKFPNLAQLNNLEKLYIGGNFIEKIASTDLEAMPRLQEIDLSDSPNLVHLGKNLLANQPQIVQISVSGCHQLYIEAEAFTLPASERVLRLRLSDLGWEEVPENIADWSQVDSIDLSNNPLECDCKLLWLKDVLDGLNDTEASHVYCQNKDQRRLQDVSRSELKCSSLLNRPRAPEDHLILVSVCVASALTLGLIVFVAVHCRQCPKKFVFSRMRDRRRGRWCCDNDVIADSEMASASSPDQICCSCILQTNRGAETHQNSSVSAHQFEFLHADFNTLNTKSSFLGSDDDYFLSLSKDRRFLTPIPVSEL